MPTHATPSARVPSPWLTPTRGKIQLLVVVGIFLLCGGLGVRAIGNVRAAAHQMSCRNNLRQIGIALHNYEATYSGFPAATTSRSTLAPDERLSWLATLGPFMESSNLYVKRDWSAAWDTPANVSLAAEQYRPYECPTGPDTLTADGNHSTHYLGIAGIGNDAASLPMKHPRAGFFGHGRVLTLKDVPGQLSTLFIVIESGRIKGAWTAGGEPTVRGLDTNDKPYLGRGAQFGGLHGSSTNALLADGSIRAIHSSIAPAVLEANVTLAAEEERLVE